jgi:hypothetical protein
LGRFPGFIGTVRLSDSPPPVTPGSVALARRLPPVRPPHLLPRDVDAPSPRAWIFELPGPNRLALRRKRRGLPGSWGDPLNLCRALRPRPSSQRLANAAMAVLSPPVSTRTTSARCLSRLPHGLSPRCLRFADALTGLVHARLACSWWLASTAQDSNLPDPLRKVSAPLTAVYISFPLSQAWPGARTLAASCQWHIRGNPYGRNRDVVR